MKNCNHCRWHYLRLQAVLSLSQSFCGTFWCCNYRNHSGWRRYGLVSTTALLSMIVPYLTVFWGWYYINDDDDEKQQLYCLMSVLSVFDIKAPFLLLCLLRYWMSEGNNILVRYLRSTIVERSTIWDFCREARPWPAERLIFTTPNKFW